MDRKSNNIISEWFIALGYSPEEVNSIMSWDNSPIELRSLEVCSNDAVSIEEFQVKDKVQELVEMTKTEALNTIKQAISEDLWINCKYSLTFLSPNDFREKYFWNEKISRCYKRIFARDLPEPEKNKYNNEIKYFYENIKTIKRLIDLPEKDDNYYIEEVKERLEKAWIDSVESLEYIWCREVNNKYKWDFIFRIYLKKLFSQGRLTDIKNTDIIEVLGLKKITVQQHKQNVLKTLEDNFWSYIDFLKETDNSIENINIESVSTLYFADTILWKTLSSINKEDFERMMVWSWFKSFSKKELLNNEPVEYIKKSLQKIWITDLYKLLINKTAHLKKDFGDNEVFKFHYKQLQWHNISEMNFSNLVDLWQVLYPNMFEENHIRQVAINSLKTLWCDDDESIRNRFYSERQRRKFFYINWNEVFSFIFNRVLNPERMRASRGWDISKITHDDVDKFIEYVKIKT